MAQYNKLNGLSLNQANMIARSLTNTIQDVCSSENDIEDRNYLLLQLNDIIKYHNESELKNEYKNG